MKDDYDTRWAKNLMKHYLVYLNQSITNKGDCYGEVDEIVDHIINAAVSRIKEELEKEKVA